jgi:hypothetical protein
MLCTSFLESHLPAKHQKRIVISAGKSCHHQTLQKTYETNAAQHWMHPSHAESRILLTGKYIDY